MIKFLGSISLLFGSGMTQISPIRDPAITIAPTIGPIINTIGTIAPVRTIVPIRTISSENVVINRTTTTLPFTSSTSTFTDINNDAEIAENTDNLTLVYALVPTGILALILVLLCVRRKRAINNNNVVNIDLNIENVLPDNSNINNNNAVIKQTSVNSARFSNHIYEEVDYESRYEMPSVGVSDTPNYENVSNGDNEYGKQVTTIV